MKCIIELFSAFFKIGLFTFGGGYAMLPMIEKEVVERKKWASMEEVMDYFAIGQCTPGVIAVNTATFVGYKIKGILGGVFATIGVITPSIIIISIIASFLRMIYDNPIIKHAFSGISIAVCALLLQALIKFYNKSVKNVFSFIIAIAAFLLSFVFGVSPVIIIVAAGICGAIYGKAKKSE